jgi:hypothetical protein
MKSLFVILGFLVMVLPCQAAPGDGGLAVGVILDDPVQISVKKWLDSTTAIDGAFHLQSGGGGGGDDFVIHVDYLMHDFSMFKIKQGSTPVHYGVGIKYEDKNETTTSLRFPVGINFHFKNAPVSIFYEYALLYDLTSDNSGLESETAFGVRYTF